MQISRRESCLSRAVTRENQSIFFDLCRTQLQVKGGRKALVPPYARYGVKAVTG